MFVFYVIMLIISCTDLRLCIEIHESQTCLTLAKNSSILEKLLTSFGGRYGVGKIYGKQS